jgi:hypothetical protein
MWVVELEMNPYVEGELALPISAGREKGIFGKSKTYRCHLGDSLHANSDSERRTCRNTLR